LWCITVMEVNDLLNSRIPWNGVHVFCDYNSAIILIFAYATLAKLWTFLYNILLAYLGKSFYMSENLMTWMAMIWLAGFRWHLTLWIMVVNVLIVLLQDLSVLKDSVSHVVWTGLMHCPCTDIYVQDTLVIFSCQFLSSIHFFSVKYFQYVSNALILSVYGN